MFGVDGILGIIFFFNDGPGRDGGQMVFVERFLDRDEVTGGGTGVIEFDFAFLLSLLVEFQNLFNLLLGLSLLNL
jgi:hypothetical protein